MNTYKLTQEQIEACNTGFEQAVSREYISVNSSKKEIYTNIYEILEFGCDDVDTLFPTDTDLKYAEDYIFYELCN